MTALMQRREDTVSIWRRFCMSLQINVWLPGAADLQVIPEKPVTSRIQTVSYTHLVETYTGNAVRRVVHPSYQAWSYAMLIQDYNQSVQNEGIRLFPCSYLHNYRRKSDDPLDAVQYMEYLKEAPAFTRGQVKQFREFIKKQIVSGDNKNLIFHIDSGRIKPSKSLQDAIVNMLKGNQEFVMIDDQKVVYEEILGLARQSQRDRKKRVIVIEGGPGTGKTVVAVNLLAQLTCCLLYTSRCV